MTWQEHSAWPAPFLATHLYRPLSSGRAFWMETEHSEPGEKERAVEWTMHQHLEHDRGGSAHSRAEAWCKASPLPCGSQGTLLTFCTQQSCCRSVSLWGPLLTQRAFGDLKQVHREKQPLVPTRRGSKQYSPQTERQGQVAELLEAGWDSLCQAQCSEGSSWTMTWDCGLSF